MIFLLNLVQLGNIYSTNSYNYRPSEHNVPGLIGWGPVLLIFLCVIVVVVPIAILLDKNRKNNIKNDPLLIDILRRANCLQPLPVIGIFTTHISLGYEMYLFSAYNHAQLPEYLLRPLAEWYREALSMKAQFEIREVLFPAQGYIGHQQGGRFTKHIETFGYIVCPISIATPPHVSPYRY